jgi:hypothetical protein
MSFFSQLIRFEGQEDGKPYFADLGSDAHGPPPLGSKVGAYTSLEELKSKAEKTNVTVGRVSALPILRKFQTFKCNYAY